MRQFWFVAFFCGLVATLYFGLYTPTPSIDAVAREVAPGAQGDDILHILAFCFLAFTGLNAFRSKTSVMFCLLALAGGLEAVQFLFPSHEPRLDDAFVSAAGVLFGATAFMMFGFALRSLARLRPSSVAGAPQGLTEIP
jgi:VanZ family protein